MARWWKEVRAVGKGTSRTHYGIARTVEGYAVDLFCGDSCIASDIDRTRAEAEQAALALERRHLAGPEIRDTLTQAVA